MKFNATSKIEFLEELEKKKIRKIRIKGLVFIILAIICLIGLFKSEKYTLWFFIGTSVFTGIATNYGKEDIKRIRKQTKQDIKEAIKEDRYYEDLFEMPYKKRYLLTKNEWAFYKSLKPVADELGYTVLSKIRVADLVEVTVKDKSAHAKYFNKINKKHVDFALAKPENLEIVLLIELDDNSHNEEQIYRDTFVETLYKKTGYKLLRTRGSGELKENISRMLDIEIKELTPTEKAKVPEIIKI